MAVSVSILALSLAVVSSSPQYFLHLSPASFDMANKKCFPGALTSMASWEEVRAVLALLSDSENDGTFWVGLRKDRTTCVDPALPLRGFTWTAGGGHDSQVSRWGAEPQHTCTAVRCAALNVQRAVPEPDWSLMPVSCKHAYPFICKLPAGYDDAPEQLEPSTVAAETTPLVPSMSTPPQGAIKPELELEHSTAEPKASKQEPKPSKPAAKTTPESDPTHDPCKPPTVLGSRSLVLDSEDSTRVRVECWWSLQVDLFCSGLPPRWRLQNSSVADLSALCTGCSPGFQQVATGHCEDVDECLSAPCRSRCINTPGSFRCICEEGEGGHRDDGSCDVTETGGPLSGVLVPVLVATAALVMLVAVVVVTVMCCRKRRSSKTRTNEE